MCAMCVSRGSAIDAVMANTAIMACLWRGITSNGVTATLWRGHYGEGVARRGVSAVSLYATANDVT